MQIKSVSGLKIDGLYPIKRHIEQKTKIYNVLTRINQRRSAPLADQCVALVERRVGIASA
jgi:hypothetical protein